MKKEFLEILHCPRCKAGMRVAVEQEDVREIRRGRLTCSGPEPHVYEIENGVVRLAAGFDHEAVKREVAYLDTTYHGDARLTDPDTIGHFPDTLTSLWPGTVNFGPDFRMLIELLPPVTPESWILDVGTAACWSSRLLAQHGGRVIALDVSESGYYGLNAADIQFRTHGVYFERVLESMTHLPFRDGSLDCITFNASFHHTPDMARTLAECHRTLKRGGMIGMVNEELVSVRRRYFSREREQTDTGSHHEISYSEFEAAANAAGFDIQYLVARHVKERLKAKINEPIGGLLAATFQRFPFLLKQLNSAVVLLTKRSAVRVAESSSPRVQVSVGGA